MQTKNELKLPNKHVVLNEEEKEMIKGGEKKNTEYIKEFLNKILKR